MRKRIAVTEVSEEPNKSVLIRKAARQRRLNPNKSVLIGKAAGQRRIAAIVPPGIAFIIRFLKIVLSMSFGFFPFSRLNCIFEKIGGRLFRFNLFVGKLCFT